MNYHKEITLIEPDHIVNNYILEEIIVVITNFGKWA